MLDNCKKETVVLTELITLPNSGAKGLIVTLNRPDRLNCFNTQVCASLSDIFYNVSQQIDKLDSQFPSSSSNDENENENDLGEIVAVILTGAGRSFCAGADLTNPPDPLKQSSDLTNHLMRNPVYHMGQIKVPIIGAIQGHVSTVLLCLIIFLFSLETNVVSIDVNYVSNKPPFIFDAMINDK